MQPRNLPEIAGFIPIHQPLEIWIVVLRFTDDVAVGVDMMFQMVHSMGFDLHYHEVRKLMYLVEAGPGERSSVVSTFLSMTDDRAQFGEFCLLKSQLRAMPPA